jgi:hypothetical protein
MCMKTTARNGCVLLCGLLGMVFTGPVGSPESGLRILVSEGEQRVGQPFPVTLKNTDNVTVTYCLALCGEIIADQEKMTAPGFDVQIKSSKRWGSLLWGCDVGANGSLEQLDPGESLNFRIKIPEPGKFRLRLAYALGELEPVAQKTSCYEALQRKHARYATSREFAVRPSN